ncbi:hypothetical protein G7Y79_00012g033370 [Physcia stellaris]|nr:hypothetical protein G7Y79_00012g033370 [Physcia stellaris]
MQLQPILFALLSAGAVAIPLSTDSTPSNTSTLEARAHWGWIASYGAEDFNCTGEQIGPRPKIHHNGNCIIFHPASDNVGINWGTDQDQSHGLFTFTDDDCKNPAGRKIQHTEDEPGFCWSVKKRGAMWGSVKNFDYP